jgi:serine/threonine protein kinase
MSEVPRSGHAGARATPAVGQGPAEGSALLPEDPSEAADRPSVVGLRVGRLLGRGGSSTVWLVTDDAERPFALKVARARRPADEVVSGPEPDGRRRGRRSAAPGAPASPPGVPGVPESRPGPAGPREGRSAAEAPQRPLTSSGSAGGVEQELRLLRRFAHEHLLRVHRIVDTDRGPGLLMDLAKGGSLLDLVTSRGPLPIPEVVTALVPVAQVLDSLHCAGALHGDVTPANILFTEEGKPLLGDFGTGRVLGSASGAVAGTPGFLDPAGRRSFDPGADVFALAAVAWFALTGRVPGPTELRPPLALIVPEVPPQLVQLIEDGLDADRDRRPTADQFARTLLSSAVPAPVDLVSAVHASVLPELLTRRADPPDADASRWHRVTRRVGFFRTRPAGVPSAAPPGRSPGSEVRRDGRPGPRPVRRAGTARRAVPDGRRARGALAVIAGLVAVVLLVAGIVLTLDVTGASRALSGSSVPAGQGDGRAPEDAVPGVVPDPVAGGERDRVPDGATGADVPPVDAPPVDAPPAEAPPTDVPPTEDRVTDPVTALGRLAARRATAFGTADPTVLADVDAAGSPAMSADIDAVAALADTGRVLRGLSIDIRDAVALTGADLEGLPEVGSLPAVAAPPEGTEAAVVRATAALSSYTETADGSPPSDTGPAPLTAAGQQELLFVLWRTEPGWRIHSVVSPPG